MKSTASVNGHPIHPMLIPYPFALLTSAAAFDVAASVSEQDDWAHTAERLTTIGLCSALLAAVPGVIDYFGSLRPRTNARRTATLHALSNVSALVCFAFTQAKREEYGLLLQSGIGLVLLGTGLLSLGGWLGGELVYREHVAVVDGADMRRLDAPHQEGISGS